MRKGPLAATEFLWTPAAVATLQRMWDAGYSPTHIAETLGCNCTKNAVVGKRNRMGLKKRREPYQPRFDTMPFRRLPEPPRFKVPPIEERPGWPTKAQLMGRRA